NSQPTTIFASIEQVSSERQPASALTANPVLPGHGDLVSRIVEGFDTRISAPRQALIVVLPNADGSVGAVSVDDGKSVTTLDRPYAAVEMRQGEAAATEFGPEEVGLALGNAAPAQPGDEEKKRKARGARKGSARRSP